jgi:ABC-2 type transport system permease protein
VWAVVYREALLRLTSPLWLFFDMAVPLLYLAMFGVGFDRALSGGLAVGATSLAYNHFFLAGVLAMTCFGNAINQSYGFFLDRDNGIFYEFLTYPMSRAQFLLGKIVFQSLMSCVQCAVILAGATLFLSIPVHAQLIPLIFAGMMIGTGAWFFFLSSFAFLIRRNDMFNTILNVAYFVLMFISSIFYPLENQPAWLRISSLLNPLTWHTDVLRFLTIGVGELSTIAMESAAFAGFLVAAFIFAVKSMQRAV